jgi:hypothetical protein
MENKLRKHKRSVSNRKGTECRGVFQGNQNKHDVGDLHPLRLIPGRILHKRTENLATGLKQGSQFIETVCLI